MNASQAVFKRPQANKVCLQQLIDVMNRVNVRGGKLNLHVFQSYPDSPMFASHEDVALNCGTVCCIMGWLAISPEFHNVGGKASRYGAPVIDGVSSIPAFAHFLGIEIPLDIPTPEYNYVSSLVGIGNCCFLYKKPIEEVTMNDVIAELETWKAELA